MDDGKAIMEEMAGSNSLDDPNYILKNLSLIPAVRPEEQSSYNKAKDAQVIVQSQVASHKQKQNAHHPPLFAAYPSPGVLSLLATAGRVPEHARTGGNRRVNVGGG
jgi:hypothetical protein